MVAERVLLHETLVGAVNALTETLATVKPRFFGAAKRVKRLAGEIARYLEFPHPWQVETAAVFSQMASITLPEEEAESVFLRKRLRPQIIALVDKFPQVIDHLLGHIPVSKRFVRFSIASSATLCPTKNRERRRVYQAFEILDAALEYDYLEVEGHDSEVIIGTLKAGSKKFNAEVIEAITQLQQKSKTRYVVNELPLDDLRVGMRLAEDLSLDTAMLVAPKGTDITKHFLQVLHNYDSCYDRSPFPKLIKVFVREPEK